MSSIQKKLIIPLSNTGRKYWYITWKKKYDDEMKIVFGKRSFVNLKFDNSYQKRKAIDWKRKRIAITWTLTRNLSENIKKIVIEKQDSKCWKVSFR